MLREMLFGTRETFPYLRCRSCGALRIEAIPTDLARHYPPDYYSGSSAVSDPPAAWTARMAERRQIQASLFGSASTTDRIVRRWAPKPSRELRGEAPLIKRSGLRSLDDPILDVGSGQVPSSLLRLRRLGFTDLTGIDPFLADGPTYPGIRLERTSLDDVGGVYRLITLHHSFEHVPDPRATLAAAERHLLPGGTILIRTPVMGTWFWETYGVDWWELDAPRHLVLHTRASIELLAAAAGLAVAEVVWDSSYLEIVASEQIRRDLAWREPGSWFVDPPAGFDESTIQSYRERAAQLNADGRAGRAGFYLRRVGDPGDDGSGRP
ncbi:MAG TPA: class I SAM-dependent methyltransferase [Patescibacteria group bacterium]|nr:class I SAM-dependent methyltransferase [Patescibacteria group bacterium]